MTQAFKTPEIQQFPSLKNGFGQQDREDLRFDMVLAEGMKFLHEH